MKFKIGRPPVWKNAQELEKTFLEYCQSLEENRLEEIDYVGKNAEKVIRYKMRPTTIEGFCIYAGLTTTTFYNYQEKNEFLGIISRIKEFCRGNCFDLAASGFIKESIIARYLGLSDKKEFTGENGGQIKVSLDLG